MNVVPLDGREGLEVALVGAKAHGLNRIRALGLPSPPAFVLTTAAFGLGPLAEPVWASVVDHVARLERLTGRRFGDDLLLSVRSGAAVSMPGMMDTVLNLGATADPYGELRAAIAAVRASWSSERAVAYRDHHRIGHDAGTAVVVQAMVLGDRDDRSGTGVAFSRDPVTGEPGLCGEWLRGAQGDALVSGERTPEPIVAMGPALLAELAAAVALLERDLGDAVEVELTVESGRLHLLQRRTAKRSPRAAVRIADDLCREGLIDRATAEARVSPDQRAAVAVEPAPVGGTELARGRSACPGTASGLAVVDLDEALDRAAAGEAVVLVRPLTSPRDVAAMLESVAVVTEHGGASSHAALVCREAGLPAVVGCGEGVVDRLAGRFVTVDGTSGRVLDGVLGS